MRNENKATPFTHNKVYDLIQNFWIMAAVVRGIQIKVWKNPEKEPHITEIWFKEKLMTSVVGGLTSQGVDIVVCKDLFTYEANMLQDQLFDRSGKTKPENYATLRRGLKNYCELNLWPTLKTIVPLLNENPVILDYCGGSGSYLECLLQHMPSAQGCLVDKAPEITPEFYDSESFKGVHTVDFKENPNWFHLEGDIGQVDFVNKFDLVMLNEILHCCDEDDMSYLLDSSYEMVKLGGQVLITEQVQNPFLDWRLKEYTKHGKSLGIEEVISMVDNTGFVVENILHSENHWLILARKTGEM